MLLCYAMLCYVMAGGGYEESAPTDAHGKCQTWSCSASSRMASVLTVASPPTAVDHSVTAHITSPTADNLAIARGTLLEIYALVSLFPWGLRSDSGIFFGGLAFLNINPYSKS